MSNSQAYDDKNQQDYDHYTDLINISIDKIRATPSLKPTITELSNLTGIHRNTLSNRGFPKEKLQEIASNRKIQTLKDKSEKKDTIKVLEDRLESAKIELVYWFRKATDSESEVEDLTQTIERLTDSLAFYQKAYADEQEKTNKLSNEVELLKSLIK